MIISRNDPKTGVGEDKNMMLQIDHIMDGVCLGGLIMAPLYLIYKMGMFLVY